MTLTLKPMHLVMAIVAVVVLLLVAQAWIRGQNAEAEMKATIAALEQQNKKLAEDNARIEASKKDVDARERAEIREIDRARAELRTAADALKVIRQAIPTAGTTAPAAAGLPDAPSAVPANGVVFNEAEQKDLAQFILTCRQCGVERQALQDRANLDAALLENAKQEAANLRQERDAAVKAVKGGSWIKRVGRQLKVIGCAGAGAGLGASRGTGPAVAGAAGGAVLCSLF